MDRAVAPLAMAGLDHDDPQTQQGEAHRGEGNIEVGEHGLPSRLGGPADAVAAPGHQQLHPTRSQPDVPVVLGSAALVIAEQGRLKHRQGRASCRPRIWTAAMTTTESCYQPTPTPPGINSQAQNATCPTARR